jgi:hypothetical protein
VPVSHALLRIVTGRGHAVRTGVWMGLLTAAQLFIAEEALVYTSVAGLVLVVVAALGHPRAVPGRARHVSVTPIWSGLHWRTGALPRSSRSPGRARALGSS